MSTPREQYDTMLDELDAESKLAFIEHVPFAKVLEELDPTAYRCGAADFEPVCDECGDTFTADDDEAEALCDDCKDEAKDEDEDEGE